jgi:glutamate synthase domain-containing protein 3
VIEGVGDHGCEYMTGGVVVVLGRTGRNFAAGMSGGLAFVLDEDGGFRERVNPEGILLEAVETADDRETLRALVEAHRAHTGSARAAELLSNWEATLPRFVKVISAEYKALLERKRAAAPAAPPAAPID